jgi:outer membrane protein assembly factor BamB
MKNIANAEFARCQSKTKKIIHKQSYLKFGFVAMLIWNLSFAQQNNEWPCFHGLNRDNKSAETGLLQKWPDQGPPLALTIPGLGDGYTGVSIAAGRIFTAGMTENQTFVLAFDMKGNLLWKQANGPAWSTTQPWATTYTGSRSTPTYDNGVLYHLGEMGRLSAFDSKTGTILWSCELSTQFEAEIPDYAYCESVTIDGEYLYCTPAGKKGFLVCLNKKNGELIWSNTGIPGTAAFSSLIMAESNGFRQHIGLSSNSIFGVDSKTGTLLWKTDFENQRSNNITDAIFYNGYVLTSTGYGKGCVLIKLASTGDKIVPETVWSTELMDNQHGGVILHNGYVFGSGNNARGWFCLDFPTGKQMWNAPGNGSITYADNMLYCLEEKGMMKLVKAIPEKFEIVSSFQVPNGGKGMYWTHPVVCGGRLYVRHMDKLFVYDIKQK